MSGINSVSNFDTSLMNQLGLTPPVANAGSTTGSGGGSTTGTVSGQLGQSDFLKLMSTQLSNQDPTQPMDSSQMLAQIAQFASVSGIQDMQSSIKSLADSFIANQTMQAASLVGHQVVTAGSNAVLGTNGTLTGAIDLTQSTSDLVVGIYDGSGQLVKTVDMGPQASGTIPFTWDGVTANGENAPGGIYQIKAQANINGSYQAATTYVAASVDSVMVDSSKQQIMLNTSSGETVKMSDVKQII